VRLNLTHLAGSVVSANPGLVALDLFAIDGRRPAIFDFAGVVVLTTAVRLNVSGLSRVDCGCSQAMMRCARIVLR
jgi:hypothetical protein